MKPSELSELSGIPIEELNLKKFGAKGEATDIETLTALVRQMKDRWDFVSPHELGLLIHVNHTRIAQLVKEEVLTQDVSTGRYPRQKNIAELLEHFRSKAKAKEAAFDDIQGIRRAERLTKEFELERLRGSYLPLSEVEKAWENIVLIVRGRLLQIANKIAPRMEYCRNQGEVETEIQKEIDEALSELSKQPEYEPENSEVNDDGK